MMRADIAIAEGKEGTKNNKKCVLKLMNNPFRFRFGKDYRNIKEQLKRLDRTVTLITLAGLVQDKLDTIMRDFSLLGVKFEVLPYIYKDVTEEEKDTLTNYIENEINRIEDIPDNLLDKVDALIMFDSLDSASKACDIIYRTLEK